MKTIIAGPRNFHCASTLLVALSEINWIITEVVSGEALGVDTLGRKWGESQGLHVEPFPADWDEFPFTAGPIRNTQMARYADALLALWDGKSTGTKDMIDQALSYGLKVYVYRIDLNKLQSVDLGDD